MKKTIICAILLFAFPASAKPASTESVQKLMEMTGASKAALQIMNQMLPNLKRLSPNAPKGFWAAFASRIDGKSLVAALVPVYQRHLSQSDVDAIIRFYETPAGRNFIAAQPAIMQESMKVGEAWGQQIALKAMKELGLAK